MRLPGYDYSQPGAYFVTICTHHRVCSLGDVGVGGLVLTRFGETVKECWEQIPVWFSSCNAEMFVMPNHLHAIVTIDGLVGAGSPGPTHDESKRRANLSQIIARFKYTSTKLANQLAGSVGNPLWQRGFYERVLRNESELNDIGAYIEANPLNWAYDRENPHARPSP